MNDLQITNMVMVDTANRKVNYTASYGDGTHIEGFVTIAEGEYEAMSFTDVKNEVQKRIADNLTTVADSTTTSGTTEETK